MIKDSDGKLQEEIENGQVDFTSAESSAYYKVFQALKKRPQINLSNQFEDVIIQRIIRLRERKATRMDFIWLGFGLLCFVTAAIFAMVITGFKFNPGIFTFFNHYYGLIGFGAIFILFLHWLDHKIIHKKSGHTEVSY